MTLGIIAAMKIEAEGIIAAMREPSQEKVGSIDFTVGYIGETRVVCAVCGIGKVFAAMCTQTMIVRYSPDAVINTGVGGALADTLHTADVVIADRLCQHDMDTSPLGDPKGLISGINKIYFDADARAVEILSAAAKEEGIGCLVGTVASGDRFVASREEKKRILDDFSAVACEMEGAAIAQVAFVNSTPFAVIRAISDSADGEASMDYPSFLPIAARSSMALTLALIQNY